MDRYLRTAPTRRLLALIGAAVALIVATAAIAVAATSGGPVPAKSSLAGAVHRALTASSVQGITARITFTNHLIDSAELQGSDPLMTGGSGRLWLSPGHGVRLELQGENGDVQLVVNDRAFRLYDGASKTVYAGTLPTDRRRWTRAGDQATVPTVAQIQSRLNELARHVVLSGAIPSDVGGKPTYTVRAAPRESGGLLGALKLAWDAMRGVPLDFALYARGVSAPVLELKLTDVGYGSVSSDVFKLPARPYGSHVVELPSFSGHARGTPDRAPRSARGEVSGAAAVARHLAFTLDAPGTLAGLPRTSVTLLGHSANAGAVVVYGQGLGAVAVLEQRARAGHNHAPASSGGGEGGSGLNIPTVSINGTTAQELDTALGTVIRFTRSGVAYTVLGSVTPDVARAAARGL